MRLPPKAEQARIVEEVGRLLTISDAVDAEIGHQVMRCARLRQSIVKWAFGGNLADQDPNDEPASVLLERIKSEASAAPTKVSRPSNARARKTA